MSLSVRPPRSPWRGLVAVTLSCILGAWQAEAATLDSGWQGSGGRNPSSDDNPMFTFRLDHREHVTIELNADMDDPYLYLLNSTGVSVVAEDDDSGEGRNARLTLDLPQGNYRLVAGTVRSGARGQFTIRTNAGALGWCFQTYEHSDFRGNETRFCTSSVPEVPNDTITSLRIPRGMYVRATENADGSGFARSYFKNVPHVGDEMNDEISKLTFGTFPMHNFYMAWVSDPQFSWTACTDSSTSSECQQQIDYFGVAEDEADNEHITRVNNQRLVQRLNELHDWLGDSRFAGVIVNGDLTEFGDQDPDLEDYDTIYTDGLTSNHYLGLGNHDYENNVNDCWMNMCTGNVMRWYVDQLDNLNPDAVDYSVGDWYWNWDLSWHGWNTGLEGGPTREWTGSFSYAFEIGNVLFLQFNNHATYTNDWFSYNWDEVGQDRYHVTSAISWARSLVAQATSEGKHVVINQHDFLADQGHPDFDQLVQDYPISADFSGHLHRRYRCGYTYGTADGGQYEACYSGAPQYGNILLGHFTDDTLYVYKLNVAQYTDDYELRLVNSSDGVITTITEDNVLELFQPSAGHHVADIPLR